MSYFRFSEYLNDKKGILNTVELQLIELQFSQYNSDYLILQLSELQDSRHPLTKVERAELQIIREIIVRRWG